MGLSELGKQIKKLDIAIGWFSRNGISTVNTQRESRSPTSFYGYDRCTRSCQYYFTYKEFADRIAIIFISAGTFGAGLGQCLARFIGG